MAAPRRRIQLNRPAPYNPHRRVNPYSFVTPPPSPFATVSPNDWKGTPEKRIPSRFPNTRVNLLLYGRDDRSLHERMQVKHFLKSLDTRIPGQRMSFTTVGARTWPHRPPQNPPSVVQNYLHGVENAVTDSYAFVESPPGNEFYNMLPLPTNLGKLQAQKDVMVDFYDTFPVQSNREVSEQFEYAINKANNILLPWTPEYASLRSLRQAPPQPAPPQ